MKYLFRQINSMRILNIRFFLSLIFYYDCQNLLLENNFLNFLSQLRKRQILDAFVLNACKRLNYNVICSCNKDT